MPQDLVAAARRGRNNGLVGPTGSTCAALRKRRRNLVPTRSGLIESFFFARQSALQAAPMRLDAEAGFDRREALGRGQLRVLRLQLDGEGEHVGRDLVAAFRAALSRQEPDKAGGVERALGFVKGRARYAEFRRGIADADAVDLVAADHFVADLKQVVGVEKRIAGE